MDNVLYTKPNLKNLVIGKICKLQKWENKFYIDFNYQRNRMGRYQKLHMMVVKYQLKGKQQL